MPKFILMSLTFLLMQSSSISAETSNFKYPALTQEQIHQVCKQMQDQIQANEQTVQNYANTIKTPKKKEEFLFEMGMEIDMQKYLLSALKDSPEFITPRIRQAYMYCLRENFFPHFYPERIAMRSLGTIYFIGRIMEAEKPYIPSKTDLPNAS